jgi:hypothetical protein
MLRSGLKESLQESLKTDNLAMWKTTKFSAANVALSGSLFLRRNTLHNTARVVGLNQRNR